MMRSHRPCLILGPVLVGLMVVGSPVIAGSVGPNWAYVQASETDGTAGRGDRYAKCLPAGTAGDRGRTLVYRVNSDGGPDVLEHAYDWYATSIHLLGTKDGTTVVRMGPWSEGRAASKDHLAFAVYRGGRLLRSYGTLDVAGRPDNVRTSVSHYQWYRRMIGFRWLRSDKSKVLR
jgi:hypothetical protein